MPDGRPVDTSPSLWTQVVPTGTETLTPRTQRHRTARDLPAHRWNSARSRAGPGIGGTLFEPGRERVQGTTRERVPQGRTMARDLPTHRANLVRTSFLGRTMARDLPAQRANPARTRSRAGPKEASAYHLGPFPRRSRRGTRVLWLTIQATTFVSDLNH